MWALLLQTNDPFLVNTRSVEDTWSTRKNEKHRISKNYFDTIDTYTCVHAHVRAWHASDTGITYYHHCISNSPHSGLCSGSCELHSSDRIGQWEKGPATELKLGTTLYRGVSATREPEWRISTGIDGSHGWNSAIECRSQFELGRWSFFPWRPILSELWSSQLPEQLATSSWILRTLKSPPHCLHAITVHQLYLRNQKVNHFLLGIGPKSAQHM